MSFISSRPHLRRVFKHLPLALIIGQLAACNSATDSTESTTEASDSNSSITVGDDTTFTQGTLVINEIVAKDASGGNDWIELYVTEGTVNLSAYTLVDDDPDHSPQALPDVTLNAGDYVVIEAIDAEATAEEGTYSVGFKLGSSDRVTLAKDGTTVSELGWEDGDAAEGYSYGLLPDGTGSATTLTPTRGATNQAASTVVTDTIVDSFPALMINEIVAKDASGGADWIEFYVSGNESVYLGDYSVRDEDTASPVSLPGVTLSPGEYYTVYATDDDLDTLPTVAFKLGSSDHVALYRGDDLVDYLEWKTGEALIGYSYGRLNGDHTLRPTMNAANQSATRGPLVINEVVTSDAEGGPDWFELYNNSDTAIELNRYSVVDDSDESEVTALPTLTLAPYGYIRIYATTSAVADGEYSVPFKLGGEDSLSLILDDETVDYLDWQDSDAPTGYSYGAYPDGSWTHRTLEVTPESANEEAVIFDNTQVESLYITIDSADWQDMLTNAVDEENHSVSVSYKGVTLDSVAMRTKGNSSLTSVANSGGTRFSFKLDTNEYVDGQRLLNLKKLNLNNQFKDPTYMREHISYGLLRDMGVPAPRSSFVNLYINGQLHGLYGLVEQVDDAFLSRHFADADGDLYKPDATGVTNAAGHTLAWIDELFSSYTAVELKTNEETTDNQAFINFVDVLNHQGDDTSALDGVVDADAVLRYLAVSTATGNLDSYQGQTAHNYYLYDHGSVFSVIPWDMNESFGSFTMGCTADEVASLYIDEPTSGALADRPLIAQLLQHEDYRNLYHDHLQTLVDGGLQQDTLAQQVADIADLIRASVYADPTAFFSASEFESGQTQSVGEIPGLLSFASERVSSVRQQLEGTLPASGNGSGSCSGAQTGGPGGGLLPPANGQVRPF